ncbi:MAG: hypothetical protein HZA54_07550 [Planctomycetes bacterium]|nr:hypothetical protein [Planctomycetota bacterium]
MDEVVIQTLKAAGFDVRLDTHFPILPVRAGADRKLLPAGEPTLVTWGGGDAKAEVSLKHIPELFAGSRQPPSFAKGPTPEYMLFFSLIERTVVDACSVSGRTDVDEEFERLYRWLRRRPAGRDGNPLFSNMQTAVRFYMSLRDVSQSEFEAVANRLSRSAGHYRTDPASRNYLRIVTQSLHEEE